MKAGPKKHHATSFRPASRYSPSVRSGMANAIVGDKVDKKSYNIKPKVMKPSSRWLYQLVSG